MRERDDPDRGEAARTDAARRGTAQSDAGDPEAGPPTVVEDETDLRDLYATWLADEYEVVTAGTASGGSRPSPGRWTRSCSTGGSPTATATRCWRAFLALDQRPDDTHTQTQTQTQTHDC